MFGTDGVRGVANTELTGELEAYLENMEPEYYTAAVQCARNNILKKIRK